jgi:hypothetical protein
MDWQRHIVSKRAGTPLETGVREGVGTAFSKQFRLI